MLGERELAATFFVEGLNAKLYPDALKAIAAGGHEVAYHAWRHEQWGELSARQQAANLARGQDAFDELGVEVAGIRPPGGQLGAGGVEVLREAGLRYASPAGEGAGVEDGVALLPFRWDDVDASCVLPGLAPVRERMTGSPEPLDPAAFLTRLDGELRRITSNGGFASFVLHLPMLDWWGEGTLEALLGRLAETQAGGDVWLAPCARTAEHLLAHRDAFGAGTTLDSASWDG
jgi:peptidoglycan/xylan/chitin deacetylase (PgdA/CDA1 family)